MSLCCCHIEWCYRVISRLKGFLWRKFNYGILLCMCDLQGVRINLWMESITRACTSLDHIISFQNISCFALYLIFNQNNFLSTWEYRLLCRYWYFSCNISISVSIFFFILISVEVDREVFFLSGIYFDLCGYNTWYRRLLEYLLHHVKLRAFSLLGFLQSYVTTRDPEVQAAVPDRWGRCLIS